MLIVHIKLNEVVSSEALEVHEHMYMVDILDKIHTRRLSRHLHLDFSE